MNDWVIGFIESWGYGGVLLLMLLENVFPPIPSELIMPFAGFVVARGELDVAGVVLAGTAGSLLGTLPWYWAGRRVGRERLRGWVERHGRWLTITPEEVDRAGDWFKRHGGGAVLLGRLVPAVRTVISAPAGLERMPLPSFLLYSAVGSALWTTLLTGVGYGLESRYQQVERWLDPLMNVVFGALVALYLWRVVRQPQRRRS